MIQTHEWIVQPDWLSSYSKYRCVLCPLYLENLDGIRPVRVRVLPRFAIHQAFSKHVQVEDGIVFWVLDLALKQFHDAQESIQGTADVYDCRHNNSKLD